MKRIVPAFLLLLCSFIGRAQGGYSIGISLKPFQSTYIYLGYYYGDKKAIADSAKLDASGSGTFTGKQPLAGGIYFIVSPKKEILFEVLIDKNQRFTIKADTSNIPNGIQFTNSIENTLFKDYTVFAAKTGGVIAKTNAEYRTAKNAKDSATVTAKLKPLGNQLQRYRDSIVTKYPNSLLAALFKAMQEPVVPPASKHPGR